MNEIPRKEKKGEIGSGEGTSETTRLVRGGTLVKLKLTRGYFVA